MPQFVEYLRRQVGLAAGCRPRDRVDHIEYRLDFVKRFAQCETVNFKDVDDMAIHLKKMTDGPDPDVCIDAVGCEAASLRAANRGMPGTPLAVFKPP